MIASSESVTEARRGAAQATLISIVGNALLVAGKMIGGLSVGSTALIADSVHSAADLASDVMVIIGVWLGTKPADDEHPYGHGKFETLATIIISVMLLAASVGIITNAVRELIAGITRPVAWPILIIAGASVLIKELLYHYTVRLGRRLHLTSMIANAWHHRSDALSSLAVLGGAIIGLLGWGHGDQVGALVVGAMISLVGVRFIYSSLGELLEARADSSIREQIQCVLDGFSEIHDAHDIRTRRVGRAIHLDLHVLVAPDLSLLKAHEISERLEQALQRSIQNTLDVLVHVEPDLPCYRTPSPKN